MTSDKTTDPYADGYAQAIRDARLVLQCNVKPRMTNGHIRMLLSEVSALEVPDPTVRADLKEEHRRG